MAEIGGISCTAKRLTVRRKQSGKRERQMEGNRFFEEFPLVNCILSYLFCTGFKAVWGTFFCFDARLCE